MKKKKNEGTTKNGLSCNDKNDPWSDHPEIQLGPIYPFFRNHKPWRTLHTVDAPFCLDYFVLLLLGLGPIRVEVRIWASDPFHLRYLLSL